MTTQMKPTLEEFTELALSYTVVPVWTEILADLETPVAAFAKLVGEGDGFLLESVEHGERWSRFSFVGRNPRATLTLRDGLISTIGDVPDSVPLDQGMLAAMEALLDVYRAPVMEDLPPLQGGLMGFLGYDVIREVENLPNAAPDDRHLPDATISVIGSLVAFDHWRQRVYMLESVAVDGLDAAQIEAAYLGATQRVQQGVADMCRPLEYVAVEPPVAEDDLLSMTSSMSGGNYQRAVEVAKDYIRAGDIFQVVLSQRFDIDLQADPFDVYRVLRQVNPSPYMYFYDSQASPLLEDPQNQWFRCKMVALSADQSRAPANAGAMTNTIAAWRQNCGRIPKKLQNTSCLLTLRATMWDVSPNLVQL